MQLCYNSWHPLEILNEGIIRTSTINKKDRGLSMSSNLQLWGHGPFKFIFISNCSWYSQFKQCSYGGSGPITYLKKPEMFRDEQEWWSSNSVVFSKIDIEKIVVMMNSPGARIHPRITRRTWKELYKKYNHVLSLEVDNTRYPL